jgi:hypothetical protein
LRSRRTPEHTQSGLPRQPGAFRQQTSNTARKTICRVDQFTAANAEDSSLNANPGCIKVVDTFRYAKHVESLILRISKPLLNKNIGLLKKVMSR